MKLYRFWLTNRVLIGMVIFFVGVGLWEFKWKPQYRPYYEAGITDYQRGDFVGALDQFKKAYDIAPNALDVIVMSGWANLKLKRFEEARFYFNRALKIDPRTEEAQLGASFVALETGRGKIDPAVINRILATRKGDPNVLILAAAALEQEGEYPKAAQVYRSLLTDKNYGHAAQVEYNRIYGLDGFEKDPVPERLPDAKRADQLQLPFRASEGSMWRNTGTGWEKLYVNGVDLGPGAPGYYPLAPPTDGATYAGWIHDAAQLNANAVRVYAVLPPAFYRAYRHYRDGGGNMALIQQIWIGPPPENDLYTPSFVDATKQKIRNVVDAVHGRGVLPPSKEQSGGIYDQDVAAGVAGFMIGGDLDSGIYSQTNIINGGKTRYSGHFVSISDAVASEVWFAEMMDYLVDYENSTYNWQHPVAIENGPDHDPARGTLTEERLRAEPAYNAGLFATYAAFPYFPEELTRDPQYLNARDSVGPNPLFGYLRLVRSRLSLPLVVTEFGMSTSIATRRLQVSGLNQGGLSETAQADLLLRLRQSIQEAGCAGGIVFELTDEWYRQGWMPEGFDTPSDRGMLWFNALDPSKQYGLIGFRTKKWQLFSGNASAWKDERELYGPAPAPVALDPYTKQHDLRSVQVAADEGYLYLKITVGCLDCVGNRRDGKTHFDQAAYAIALNTLPGRAGVKTLPFGDLQLTSGANFLLYLGDAGTSRLLVAENYNPYEVAPRLDFPKEIQLRYRRAFETRAATIGGFINFPTANSESPSMFHYGSGDPASKDFDSTAEWYADVAHSAILVRIPWGKLLVVDPSHLDVFASYTERQGLVPAPTPGVTISVYALKTNGSDSNDLAKMTVAMSLPAAGNVQPALFTWERWESVTPQPYFKKSYTALQSQFSQGQNVSNQRTDLQLPARVR